MTFPPEVTSTPFGPAREDIDAWFGDPSFEGSEHPEADRYDSLEYEWDGELE